MNNPLQGARLREFIDTSNPEEALAFLQEHPSELLTDAAIADLQQLRNEETNSDRQKRLDERLQMLEEAKAWRDWWEQASPMEQLFARFLYTEHADDLMALALSTSPEDLDELETIAEAESAEAEGDEAEAMRERLAILREFREPGGALEQAQTLIDNLIEWMKAPDGAASEAYLQQHANELLTDQAQAMLELLLRMNDNNSQMQWLLGLLARCRELGIAEAYAELRNSSEAAEEPTRTPVQQAVLEFIEAETDAAARELLAVNDSPLLTLDARRLLESYVKAYGQQNAEVRAHLEARLALWYEVRLGPKPEVVQPPSTPPPELITSGRPGELEFQVPGKAKYWIIEASHCAIGDNAQTLNILNVGRVPLQWQKPQQFRTDLTESAVGRIGELNDLHERLQSGASAAVVAFL